MKDFIFNLLNGSWLLAAIALVGTVYFAITYYRTNKAVNAYRNDTQQKLVNGQAFGEYFNTRRTDIYALGKDNKKFVTSDGNPVSLPDDEPLELIFHRLGADSEIPSLGYAVVCEKTDVGGADNALRLYFCPENHAKAEWKVISINNKLFICEHPLMGTLTKSLPTDRNLRNGDIVELISVIHSGKENLLLFSDKPEERPLVLRYEVL